MPALEPTHYAAIRQLLLAGDVQARVVENQKAYWIAVALVDKTEVLWSNSAQADVWAYTKVSEEGELEGAKTEMPWDAQPWDVAHMIATYDYEAPLLPEGESL